ncbi:MAG: hypothetical protein A3E78_01995 [Alphaproteobacteria bacterium RIFCSPHIGHO2_12_FULL_63_12]|nr:MAG: hypothetical protein A3E78_01995 [Alphaproteobacteria bacterium RIFCSPHIGHO2_12_FULL_63_12]
MGGTPSPIPRDVPSIVTGNRDPGGTVSQRIIADVQDEIHLYMPTSAPLTALTAMLRKKRETTQYAFDWLEKDEFPRTVELAGAETSATTTLDVKTGQGDRVAANFILRNRRTGEQVLVTSVATDALTVVRAIGDTTGQDMLAGDQLDFLRAVYKDGATIGTLKSIKEDRQYNYTEIIRTPFGFTGRQMNTDLYGGKDPLTEKKWHGIEHAKSIELAFLFGKRHTRTPDTIQSMTGGVEYFVKTNIWDLNSQKPTERAFVEYLEFAMKYGRGGSNERGGDATKYLFCSRRWLTEIEFWAKDRIQYRNVDKRVGLKVGQYDTSHGTVMLVMDPILTDAYADYAFLLDLNHVRYAYHQGRDTKLLDNRQDPSLDGEQLEYMTDFGAQIELEAAHGVMKGLPI